MLLNWIQKRLGLLEEPHLEEIHEQLMQAAHRIRGLGAKCSTAEADAAVAAVGDTINFIARKDPILGASVTRRILATGTPPQYWQGHPDMRVLLDQKLATVDQLARNVETELDRIERARLKYTAYLSLGAATLALMSVLKDIFDVLAGK